MITQLELTKQNLNFKSDTKKYLIKKSFNQKYIDCRSDIIDVLKYRDEKTINRLKRMNEVITIKKK